MIAWRPGNLLLFGRLDRYVGGLFGMSYATAMLLVVGLFVVADFATHLAWFEPAEDGSSVSMFVVLEYYALSVPFLYAQASPFVTVVAAMFTVTRLVKKNEFSAGLSAGVSSQRLLLAVFLGAVAAAAATFIIRESASGFVGARRDALFDRIDERREEAVLTNFWFRDAAQNVVHLGEFRAGTALGRPPAGKQLEATFTRRGVVVSVAADEFHWVDGPGRSGWRLVGGRVREVGLESKLEPVEWLEEVRFTPEDVLTADKARDRVLELSFQQVLRLSARDPDNTSYQTLLQYLLTFPLANIVLVLCAVPFLVGRERGKGGEAVMGGLLLCVGFFCVDFVTRSMGLSGDLSPLMSAWLPVLLFGALGISLTHFMRT
ncbi:MAG: LptF/LptG family permease [Planctomycetes bacterium]|jgi:lipopolysaccharide export system permease protein|nr:LptF/LptG family permease [Planctomycetota bacterium]